MSKISEASNWVFDKVKNVFTRRGAELDWDYYDVDVFSSPPPPPPEVLDYSEELEVVEEVDNMADADGQQAEQKDKQPRVVDEPPLKDIRQLPTGNDLLLRTTPPNTKQKKQERLLPLSLSLKQKKGGDEKKSWSFGSLTTFFSGSSKKKKEEKYIPEETTPFYSEPLNLNLEIYQPTTSGGGGLQGQGLGQDDTADTIIDRGSLDKYLKRNKKEDSVGLLNSDSEGDSDDSNASIATVVHDALAERSSSPTVSDDEDEYTNAFATPHTSDNEGHDNDDDVTEPRDKKPVLSLPGQSEQQSNDEQKTSPQQSDEEKTPKPIDKQFEFSQPPGQSDGQKSPQPSSDGLQPQPSDQQMTPLQQFDFSQYIQKTPLVQSNGQKSPPLLQSSGFDFGTDDQKPTSSPQQQSDKQQLSPRQDGQKMNPPKDQLPQQNQDQLHPSPGPGYGQPIGDPSLSTKDQESIDKQPLGHQQKEQQIIRPEDQPLPPDEEEEDLSPNPPPSDGQDQSQQQSNQFPKEVEISYPPPSSDLSSKANLEYVGKDGTYNVYIVKSSGGDGDGDKQHDETAGRKSPLLPSDQSKGGQNDKKSSSPSGQTVEQDLTPHTEQQQQSGKSDGGDGHQSDTGSQKSSKSPIPGGQDDGHQSSGQSGKQGGDHSDTDSSDDKGGKQGKQGEQEEDEVAWAFKMGLTEPSCVSLFEFKPRLGDELYFEKGVIIYLLSQPAENWFEGSTINGDSGYFPANYVKVIVPLPEELSYKPPKGDDTQDETVKRPKDDGHKQQGDDDQGSSGKGDGDDGGGDSGPGDDLLSPQDLERKLRFTRLRNIYNWMLKRNEKWETTSLGSIGIFYYARNIDEPYIDSMSNNDIDHAYVSTVYDFDHFFLKSMTVLCVCGYTIRFNDNMTMVVHKNNSEPVCEIDYMDDFSKLKMADMDMPLFFDLHEDSRAVPAPPEQPEQTKTYDDDFHTHHDDFDEETEEERLRELAERERRMQLEKEQEERKDLERRMQLDREQREYEEQQKKIGIIAQEAERYTRLISQIYDQKKEQYAKVEKERSDLLTQYSLLSLILTDNTAPDNDKQSASQALDDIKSQLDDFDNRSDDIKNDLKICDKHLNRIDDFYNTPDDDERASIRRELQGYLSSIIDKGRDREAQEQEEVLREIADDDEAYGRDTKSSLLTEEEEDRQARFNRYARTTSEADAVVDDYEGLIDFELPQLNLLEYNPVMYDENYESEYYQSLASNLTEEEEEQVAKVMELSMRSLEEDEARRQRERERILTQQLVDENREKLQERVQQKELSNQKRKEKMEGYKRSIMKPAATRRKIGGMLQMRRSHYPNFRSKKKKFKKPKKPFQIEEEEEEEGELVLKKDDVSAAISKYRDQEGQQVEISFDDNDTVIDDDEEPKAVAKKKYLQQDEVEYTCDAAIDEFKAITKKLDWQGLDASDLDTPNDIMEDLNYEVKNEVKKKDINVTKIISDMTKCYPSWTTLITSIVPVLYKLMVCNIELFWPDSGGEKILWPGIRYAADGKVIESARTCEYTCL